MRHAVESGARLIGSLSPVVNGVAATTCASALLVDLPPVTLDFLGVALGHAGILAMIEGGTVECRVTGKSTLSFFSDEIVFLWRQGEHGGIWPTEVHMVEVAAAAANATFGSMPWFPPESLP